MLSWLSLMPRCAGGVRVTLAPPAMGPWLGLMAQWPSPLVQWAVRVMLPVTGWVKS